MRSYLPALLALAATACASREYVPAPSEAYPPPWTSMALIEGPSVAPPADDIPESQRRAWFEAQRPAPPPVTTTRVERVVVREREPIRYVRERDRHDDWYLPISLSLGWWAGWGNRHGHGWGWGVSLHDRWRW